MEVLGARPARVDNGLPAQYPAFNEFVARNRRPSPEGSHGEQTGSIDVPGVVEDAVQQRRTPSELLEDAFQRIRQDLAEELLARLKVCSPGFFERLVVELLVKMGYGGSRKDAGEAVGHTGDEGIHAIIKQDRLALDTIYIQAKPSAH